MSNLQVWSLAATVLIGFGVAALVGLFAIDKVRERQAPKMPPLDLARLHVTPSPKIAERRRADHSITWTVPSRTVRHPHPPLRPSWGTWPTAEYHPVVPRPARRPSPRTRDPRCTRTVGFTKVVGYPATGCHLSIALITPVGGNRG